MENLIGHRILTESADHVRAPKQVAILHAPSRERFLLEG
jgi:hypothetical protein